MKFDNEDFKKRKDMEKQVVRKLLEDMIAAGFSVSVYDGGSYPLRRSTDIEKIISEMFACDIEWLDFHNDPDPVKIFGQLMLIYGNDGYDVIADYTTNLEPYMKGVNELVDKLGEEYATQWLANRKK